MAVALAALIPYLSTLGFDFVYDDLPFIALNPNMRRLSWAVEVFWDGTVIARHGWDPIWRPLRTWIWALLFGVAGPNPFAFHLLSVLTHIAASIAAFGLAARLSKDRNCGLIAALIFALHPVQSEAVALAASLSDPLTAAFIFASLSFFLDGKRPLALAGTVGALLSKETAVIFPALYLLTRYLSPNAGDMSRSRLRRDLAGIVAVVSAYLVIRAFVVTDMSGESRESVPVGLPTILTSFLNYWKLLILPVNLHLHYPLVHEDSGWTTRTVAALLSWLVILSLPIWRAVSRHFRFGLIWFVSLLPWIPAVAAATGHHFFLVQERYLYPAIFGPALFIAATVQRPLLATRTIAAVVFSMMALWTWHESQRWSSELAVWSRQVEIDPRTAPAQGAMGNLAFFRGDTIAMIEFHETAVAIDPNHVHGWLDLSLSRLRIGDPDGAERAAKRALELDSITPIAWHRMACARAARGESAAALAAIDSWATVAGPRDGRPDALRADLFRSSGLRGDAFHHMMKAAAKEPRVAEFRKNAAVLLYEMGDRTSAIMLAKEAALLDPWDRSVREVYIGVNQRAR